MQKKYWIEKTIVKGRPDRQLGERALGKALWSPRRDKRGADIYKNMREVEEGDIVLHLTDNIEFSGVSIVNKKVIKTDGMSETAWDGPAYLIKLSDFIELDPPINRAELLNNIHKKNLIKISEESEVFYNSQLNLRQGAYLTPCPLELAVLINSIYFDKSGSNLPHFTSKMITNYKDNAQQELFDKRNFIKDLKQSGLHYTEELVTRFVASLLTKPFVLLTGLSGSGKTKIAQSFVQWICEDKSQYKIIPVGSDWTNREPLLGYPNGLNSEEYILPDSGALNLIIEAAKAENQHKPYFLILDEMNLSHVERYFADFLSIMESEDNIMLYSGSQRKSPDGTEIPLQISWPKNLFIIGTINIDETTYMFSPKVLDRANTIEFRVDTDNIRKFFDSPAKTDLSVLLGKGASMAQHFLTLAADNHIEIEKTYTGIFVQFFDELKKIGAEFGYRTAVEMLLLIKKLNVVGTFTKEQSTDIAVMQKLLPKLHGSRSKISKVLDALIALCLKNGKTFSIAKSEEVNQQNILYPIAFEKLVRMYKNALDNGFTNYAEA